ncbi:MAG: enoyl-CoA hydratase/isomerase family protein [Candidatus Hydrogenedentes bacterium]|nr:enoyl-CoA hydratase/isomerase family protein [Candidatus Hydrogenedentota bacterium]
MAYQNIIVEEAENWAWITLNRPKANALSLELMLELGAALGEWRDHRAVRCVLITGGGDRFFSAGADVPTIQKTLGNPITGGSLLEAGVKTVNAIEAYPKPVIAVVNGMAFGGGCELTLACHLRIAADTAQFGQPEINLGIIPGWGGTHRLPRLIGESRAMEWLLTGRTFSAQEALQAGLVCKVVPKEALKSAASELAKVIAGKPVAATHATLEVIRERALYPERGIELEATAFAKVAATKDAAEGVAAFLEKRPAKFTGE